MKGAPPTTRNHRLIGRPLTTDLGGRGRRSAGSLPFTEIALPYFCMNFYRNAFKGTLRPVPHPPACHFREEKVPKDSAASHYATRCASPAASHFILFFMISPGSCDIFPPIAFLSTLVWKSGMWFAQEPMGEGGCIEVPPSPPPLYKRSPMGTTSNLFL